MNNPLSEMLALGRVPAAVVGDIRAIAEAALRVSEQMVRTMSQRTAVIEQTLLDLKEKVDAATELLPDPGSEGRGPLLEAKDVITGG